MANAGLWYLLKGFRGSSRSTFVIEPDLPVDRRTYTNLGLPSVLELHSVQELPSRRFPTSGGLYAGVGNAAKCVTDSLPRIGTRGTTYLQCRTYSFQSFSENGTQRPVLSPLKPNDRHEKDGLNAASVLALACPFPNSDFEIRTLFSTEHRQDLSYLLYLQERWGRELWPPKCNTF